MTSKRTAQDRLYEEASGEFGAAIGRLSRVYESDPELRQDLLQDLHLALWRSFRSYDARCSLRTWVYRVAHNVAASHVMQQRRKRGLVFVGLDELERLPDSADPEQTAGRRETWERLTALIGRLRPLDRQVILSWLEGLDATAIAEITGLQPGNVATKVHRIKHILAHRFREGGLR